ncbi:MAG TPA: 4-alpha-glucanotransferase, partial [Candidatus Methylacidiphilales bacterium]
PPITSLRPLSLATYATHDHAPLAVQYANLVLHAAGEGEPAALAKTELESFLKLVGWNGPKPEALDDALLEASQRTLLGSPCVIAAFLTSDMLGNRQRFNLPGTYGAGTWAERLEHPLDELLRHSSYGPRLKKLRDLIAKSGRVRPQAAASPATDSAVQEPAMAGA